MTDAQRASASRLKADQYRVSLLFVKSGHLGERFDDTHVTGLASASLVCVSIHTHAHGTSYARSLAWT